MTPKYGSAGAVRRNVAGLVKPPNREPVSQSARRLLKVEEGGAMVPWNGDLVPYMWEPMDCLKSRRFDAVIFAGPARTSKTAALVDGWICDTVVNNPADMLVVQISEEKAREHSKKRISRYFNASPEIRACLSPRGHDNNVHDKIFKAGHYLKIGWPSKNIFASSDWKYVALTDYDRMEQDVGGEGSGFLLAGKRTQTFMSSGMVLAESSPGYEVLDPGHVIKNRHEAPPTLGILSIYNEGDRRLFYWQCPHCGEWFEPDFYLLDYDKDQRDPFKASREVTLPCPACAEVLTETAKPRLNLGGQWLREGEWLDQNGQRHGDPRQSRYASFWQKGPTAAFQTWNQLVYKYVSALRKFEELGDLHDLKTTVNTDQGLPFTPPRNNAQSHEQLRERASELGQRTVPPWVRFLLASVDVQGGSKRRFEVMVLGVGAELESVVIDRFPIVHSKRVGPDGKPERVQPNVHLEDWDLLTEHVVAASYEIDDDSGRRLPVLKMAYDTNGEEGVWDNALEYYRRLRADGLHHKLMPIKGGSSKPSATAPIVDKKHPTSINRAERKSKARGDVPIYFLQTDRLKDTATAALRQEHPGRRYVHFPAWLPDSFYQELTYEQRGPDGKWRKPGKGANESFDLLAYCWAILFERKADKIDWDAPPPWALPIDSNPDVQASGQTGPAELPRRRRRR